MVPIFWIVLLSTIAQTFAWNAAGHKLIANLAFNYCQPATQIKITNELHASNTNLASAAVWLDSVRFKKRYRYLQPYHYVSIPYGDRHYFPKQKNHVNALTALSKAKKILLTSHEKERRILALRIILHVVADIHQPLHACNYFSKTFTDGDRGGNLYPVPKMSGYQNLHALWDDGAGVLAEEFAEGNCKVSRSKPRQWIKNSHILAIKYAYFPPKKDFQLYQQNTRKIAKKQIYIAACHLAAMLDEIYML